MNTVRGKISCDIRQIGKDWHFGVCYCDESLRPFKGNIRHVYVASNGWKLIMGLCDTPRVWIAAKAVMLLSCNEVHDDTESIIDFPVGISEMGKVMIVNEVRDALTEASNGDWTVQELK